MRFLFTTTLLLFSLCPLFFHCSEPVKKPTALQVFVSTPPQKYFVEKIGKGLLDVNVLIPAGSSPHSYEPKPAQLARLSQSKLFFAIGGDFEKAWLPRVSKDLHQLKIVYAINETENDHSSDHHEHSHGLDPHIWLSPELVLKQADTIAAELALLDSVNKEVYLKNCEAFKAEIRELQQKIRSLLRNCRPGQPFMVFHPSWGYFAEEFGLTQISVEVEGKEPGMKEMESIIRKAKESRIRTIFVQPQFSKRTVEVIAGQLKAEIVIADPLAEDWSGSLLSLAESLGKNE